MEKKGNVRRISDKKKNKPKIRFNIWMMIIIFALSFAGCFVLYMAAANIDSDFFNDEFSTIRVEDSSSDDGLSDEQSGVSTDDSESSESPEQAIVSNPVPSSAAVDISYLENCCLVTDSTLLGMTNSGFKDVIGSDTLNAVSANTTKVESNYGTVTVYETLKIKKPMNVYIMLGSDIGSSSTDEMISSYASLVSNLQTSIPDMKIYLMQLPPVFDDAERNAAINDYNTRLLSLADSMSVYCIDTNTELKDNNGNLREDYRELADDGYTYIYSSAYYDAILGYILTHTI